MDQPQEEKKKRRWLIVVILLLLLLLLLFLLHRCDCEKPKPKPEPDRPPTSAGETSPGTEQVLAKLTVKLLDEKKALLAGSFEISVYAEGSFDTPVKTSDKNAVPMDLPAGEYAVLAEVGGVSMWKRGVTLGPEEARTVVLACGMGTLGIHGTFDGEKPLSKDYFGDFAVYGCHDMTCKKPLHKVREYGNRTPKFSVPTGSYIVTLSYRTPGVALTGRTEFVWVQGGEEAVAEVNLNGGCIRAKGTLDGKTGLSKHYHLDVGIFRADDAKCSKRISFKRDMANRNLTLFVPAGTYTVRYKYHTPGNPLEGEEKNLTVEAGKTVRSAVNFNAGVLRVRTVGLDGLPLSSNKWVFVKMYRSQDKEKKTSVAGSREYGNKTRYFYVPAGSYFVVGEIREGRGMKGRLDGVTVIAGKTENVTIQLKK